MNNLQRIDWPLVRRVLRDNWLEFACLALAGFVSGAMVMMVLL